jgi:hypothetical protein
MRATVRLDDRLTLTAEHPVAVPGGWRPAGSLQPGDMITGGNGNPRALRAVGAGKPAQCWDIGVDSPHNVITEDIVVHNKSRIFVDDFDDAWLRLWPRPGHIQTIWSSDATPSEAGGAP